MQAGAVGPDQECLRAQQDEPGHGAQRVQVDDQWNLRVPGPGKLAEVAEERHVGDAWRKPGDDQHKQQQEEQLQHHRNLHLEQN